MRIPEEATLAKRKVVMPPRTESGIIRKRVPNFEKTPIKIKKKQHMYPADVFAHLIGGREKNEMLVFLF
jgi:hypothetical protein